MMKEDDLSDGPNLGYHTETMRAVADGLEEWLAKLPNNLEKDGFKYLTPEAVETLVLEGVVEPMREEAFDIDMQKSGLFE